MNTTLSTAPGRQDHPPQSRAVTWQPARRVSLLDQLALHVGIALIKWGRRPNQLESSERRARRVEQHLARLVREREHERSLRLHLPVR